MTASQTRAHAVSEPPHHDPTPIPGELVRLATPEIARLDLVPDLAPGARWSIAIRRTESRGHGGHEATSGLVASAARTPRLTLAHVSVSRPETWDCAPGVTPQELLRAALGPWLFAAALGRGCMPLILPTSDIVLPGLGTIPEDAVHVSRGVTPGTGVEIAAGQGCLCVNDGAMRPAMAALPAITTAMIGSETPYTDAEPMATPAYWIFAAVAAALNTEVRVARRSDAGGTGPKRPASAPATCLDALHIAGLHLGRALSTAPDTVSAEVIERDHELGGKWLLALAADGHAPEANLAQALRTGRADGAADLHTAITTLAIAALDAAPHHGALMRPDADRPAPSSAHERMERHRAESRIAHAARGVAAIFGGANENAAIFGGASKNAATLGGAGETAAIREGASKNTPIREGAGRHAAHIIPGG